MGSLDGMLLISSPALVDPNFRRTVVLVAVHGEEGAMGLVLNRASDLSVGEAVPDLSAIVGVDARVFIGGPVQPRAVLVLAEFEDPARAASIVVGDVGFLRAEGDLEGLAPAVRRARVFAGYSGWSPGQLEDELTEGSWITAPVGDVDLFPDDEEDIFVTALEEKGGPFRLLATMPEHPELN